LLRVVTGIGIGGTIASVAVIVSEYSPDRWRSVALGVYAAGYSIGGTIGGALTASAVPRFGWRSAFAIGGVLSLALVPIAWRQLPESMDFLLTRQPKFALRKVNELLRALKQATVDALPPRPLMLNGSKERLSAALALLISPITVLGWFVFFCTMAGFYFIVSWTPRLLTAAGLSAKQGLTGGVVLSVGGIVGSALFAWAASRVDARRLLTISLVGTALLCGAFGFTLGSLHAALWTALLLGVIANPGCVWGSSRPRLAPCSFIRAVRRPFCNRGTRDAARVRART